MARWDFLKTGGANLTPMLNTPLRNISHGDPVAATAWQQQLDKVKQMAQLQLEIDRKRGWAGLTPVQSSFGAGFGEALTAPYQAGQVQKEMDWKTMLQGQRAEQDKGYLGEQYAQKKGWAEFAEPYDTRAEQRAMQNQVTLTRLLAEQGIDLDENTQRRALAFYETIKDHPNRDAMFRDELLRLQAESYGKGYSWAAGQKAGWGK